ncbi:MAG: hypothetical protein EBZ47_01555 [Chlamydiae bacterium]|nr:hypothetical protein [Chlamydiota bacterium]
MKKRTSPYRLLEWQNQSIFQFCPPWRSSSEIQKAPASTINQRLVIFRPIFLLIKYFISSPLA